MFLEHLGNAVAHLDARAGDEPVIVFLAERRLGHLPIGNGGRLLPAKKHRLGTPGTGRCGSAAAGECPGWVDMPVQVLSTKVEISGTLRIITPSHTRSPSWKMGLSFIPWPSRERASLFAV